MTPVEGYVAVIETAVQELRLQATRLAAVAQGLGEEPAAPVMRPSSGWAGTVHRSPAGEVVLRARLAYATVDLPLTERGARELAAMLLIGAEAPR